MENNADLIQRLRKEYLRAGLAEGDLAADPITQFAGWFKEALTAELYEPHAMVLSTVGATGEPSSRAVLLKDFDASGFLFCTNFDSRKGQEISNNSSVALLFLWSELERQVRITGTAHPVDALVSDRYWNARPRGSQLSALASAQSHEIASRDLLMTERSRLELQYGEQAIPRPSNWGAYRVTPNEFEFWQGRENRLHDRLRYQRDGVGWRTSRLAP